MNYSQLKRSKKDWGLLFFKWLLFCAVLSYLFYKSVVVFLCFLPFFVFFQEFEKKKKIKERKNLLSLQFNEMLQTMITALKSGTSLERAVLLTKTALGEIYDKGEMIIKEIDLIERGLGMNIPIENLFLEFGKRSGVEEIKEFSEVLAVSKRTGGNVIKAMENTASFLIEKKELEGEIKALISGKKMEGRAMGFILPGMLFYINLAMPEVSKSLYHGVIGKMTMTGIFVGYLICLFWFDKISEIKV